MSGPPKKMGLSLYADLLGDKSKQQGATISGAPVKYDVKKDDDSDGAQKKKDASLQFQPIKRPQVSVKINRPTQKKAGGGGAAHMFSSSTTNASLPTSASSPDKATSTISSTPTQQPGVQRSNFEDWVGDEDDEYFFDNRPKHERGGKKKKKKKGGQHEAMRVWDWDDIYDPTLPNNYADYKGSEEQYREIRDWKARLYYHQLKEAKKKSSGMAARPDDLEDSRDERPMNRMFAPPPMNFAPPSFDDAPARPPATDDDDYYPPSVPSRPPATSDSYEPPATITPVPDDSTGEDAYMRRMRMSGAAPPPPPTDPRLAGRAQQAPIVPAFAPASAPKQTPAENADIAAKKAEAAAKIAAFKAKMEAHKAAKAGNGAAAASPTPPAQTTMAATPASQPVGSANTQTEAQQLPSPPPPPPPEEAAQTQEPGSTISRAPIRYNLPPPDAAMPSTADEDVPMDESENPDAPKSNRPGQKGFAERLLKKYGWEKGKGLGVEGNEGITTAIFAKAEKRKKRSDAEGGGFAAPANMGKIVGGKRRKVENNAQGDEGAEGGAGETEALPYGPLSEVIKLENMLEGLDVDDEVQNKDLYGEIGKEMEEQYGKVERLFLWRKDAGGQDDVFVKFTSQLSALRAVGACDGMEFAGNTVKARFFSVEKFEAREFE